MELYFPITSANATYNVVVDPQNTIAESDEGNNTLSYFAITPTPPALCTPTSTPSSNLSTPIPVGRIRKQRPFLGLCFLIVRIARLIGVNIN